MTSGDLLYRPEEFPGAILCERKDKVLRGLSLMPDHCVQRLARITLSIRPNTFTGKGWIETRLFRIATQLPRLLGVLADDPAPDNSRGNKELVIIVETVPAPDTHRVGLFQPHPQIRGYKKDTQAILMKKKEMAVHRIVYCWTRSARRERSVSGNISSH